MQHLYLSAYGGVPLHRDFQLTKSFLNSVKPFILVEEKDWPLGSEPVPEFLPSARFKSGINLVLDTVDLQG